MTAPPGPFVEPADASNDALWLQRARAERPFATQFFNSPINQGKAWRALAGLQAGTRLLVSGDSDMIWPASGTYGPEGSNEHGSMKGDAAQGFAVGARPGQPPNLVRIMFDTDDKWRAFCLALDADGGVWVRGGCGVILLTQATFPTTRSTLSASRPTTRRSTCHTPASQGCRCRSARRRWSEGGSSSTTLGRCGSLMTGRVG